MYYMNTRGGRTLHPCVATNYSPVCLEILERDKPHSVAMTSNDETSRPDTGLERSEWWAATFWIALGMVLIGLVIPIAGLQFELLLPGIVLVLYGAFIHWQPEIAHSTARWIGFVWIVLGILTLTFVNFVSLYWTYELTGILVGLFMILVGLFGLLDL